MTYRSKGALGARPASWWIFTSVTLFSTALALVIGCDTPPPPAADGGPIDAGFIPPDGSVHCESAADCDDGIGCTRDTCLTEIQICSHVNDNPSCDDGIFCNGPERCDFFEGCVHEATHETCDDGNVCTIDRCNEDQTICEHAPRDLDFDGDADFFCDGGTDCDDRDPTRSGHAPELCDDSIDNDCDMMVDEASCGRPAHDTCDDPLELTASGVTMLPVRAASSDYTLGCVGFAEPDLVVSFTLDAPHDVTLIGDSELSSVELALRTDCADAHSEIACEEFGFPATLRARALQPGTYYVIVQAFDDVTLNLQIEDATVPPTNESCRTPIVIPETGGHYAGSFVGVTDDVATSCDPNLADLVYQLDLTAESDVRVDLAATGGGTMRWSLQPTCGDAGSQYRCRTGSPASGTIHRVPMGTYFLVIEASPTLEPDYSLTVTVSPPTDPVVGDTCASPIPLELDVPYSGSLARAEDDYDTTCGFDYRDIVHSFRLDAQSDVTIVVQGGAYMNGALRTDCGTGSELRCDSGTNFVTHVRALAMGTYYFVVESPGQGSYTATVTATTPPTVPTPVPDGANDVCGGAILIPETGGLWSGSTVVAQNDYDPSFCGSFGSPAHDVTFRLDLTQRSIVTISTEGSLFNTIVYREVAPCASSSDLSCDDDSGPGTTSQLTETLNAGSYFYILDGWNTSAQGHYELEALITPTP